MAEAGPAYSEVYRERPHCRAATLQSTVIKKANDRLPDTRFCLHNSLVLFTFVVLFAADLYLSAFCIENVYIYMYWFKEQSSYGNTKKINFLQSLYLND